MAVVGDTLILTEIGLTPFSSLPSLNREGWQAIDLMIHTGLSQDWVTGLRTMGAQEIITVTTQRGYSLTGTPDHMILFLNSSGVPSWVKLKQLKYNTTVIIQADTYPLTTKYIYKPPKNIDEVVVPKFLEEKFCEFLGYFLIRGIIAKHEGSLKAGVLIHKNDDGRIMDFIINNASYLFGLNLFEWNEMSNILKGNYKSVGFKETGFINYLREIGMIQEQPTIPDMILYGGREYIYAFLRGAFTASTTPKLADGIKIIIPYLDLAKQLQQILLSVGFITDISPSYNKLINKMEFGIYIDNDFKGLYKERIGFLNSIQSDVFSNQPCVKEKPMQKKKNLLDTQFTDVIVYTAKSKGKVYDLQIREKSTYIGNGFINASV